MNQLKVKKIKKKSKGFLESLMNKINVKSFGSVLRNADLNHMPRASAPTSKSSQHQVQDPY